MQTISRLKHYEKILGMSHRRKQLFIFRLCGFVLHAEDCPSTRAAEEAPLLRLQYPLCYRFLDSENRVEILTEYFKTKVIIFPEPGREINFIDCRFETITVMDTEIPYSELEPFMAPE
jgi:hypothetical protein